MKQNKEMTNKEKKSYNYCIPSPMASFMKRIDDRTQMEASLLSMFFLLIGLLAFGIYFVGFSGFSWIAKIMTGFNTVCGFIFLFSYLVTTFQQYQALMETQAIVGQFGTEEPFPTGSSPKEPFPDNSNLKMMKGGLDK